MDLEYEVISTIIQGGGTGVIGYFIWSMMRDIKSVRNDMNIMTASINKKLYRDDGKMIYQRLDDCKEQMCVHANDINNIGVKVNQNAHALTKLEMQVAMLAGQAEKAKRQDHGA